MSDRNVVIVHTGVANTASVLVGLKRAGVAGTLSTCPDEIEFAPRLVVPGVGAFGAAMSRLNELNLVEPLRRRLERGLPTLAICLGMQVLCDESEESPGIRGLGVIRGAITRFAPPTRCPQLGWNRVEPSPTCSLIAPGFAYFANSFRLAQSPSPREGLGWPPGWNFAHAHHGGPFVAAIERGPILACQFHPELSGSWGLALLTRWLASEAPPSGRGWGGPALISSEPAPC